MKRGQVGCTRVPRMSSSPGAPPASVPLGPRLLFGATQGAIGGAVLGAILGVIVASVQPKRVVGLDAAVLPIRTRRLWADSHMLQLTTEVLRHMDPRSTATRISITRSVDALLETELFRNMPGRLVAANRHYQALLRSLKEVSHGADGELSFASEELSGACDDIVHNICMD